MHFKRLGSLLFASTAMVLALISGSASAGLEFQVTPTSSSNHPGGSGSFDILLADTSSTDSYEVSTYDLFVQATGAGFSFTAETMSTAGLGYVFVDPIVNQPGFGPFVISSTPTSFHVGDSEFDLAGARIIAPGQAYGIVHVTYVIDSSAPLGPVVISIGSNSQVVNIDNVDQGATGVSGTINIVSAVPEPSGLLLGLASLGLSAAWAGRNGFDRFRAARGL